MRQAQLSMRLGCRVSGQRLQHGRQGLHVLLCIHPCSALGDDVRFQLAHAVRDLHIP